MRMMKMLVTKKKMMRYSIMMESSECCLNSL